MKKPIATTFLVTFPLLVKTARLKAYGFIAIVFLAGCTATVVRWNSVKMREPPPLGVNAKNALG